MDSMVGGSRKMVNVVLGVAGVALAGVVLWSASGVLGTSGGKAGTAAIATAEAATSSRPDEDSVLATVNGQHVTEYEISGIVQAGVDRAIAVDRYINKVVAAEKGRQLYKAEAEVALRAAEREVLSTLYTTRRMQELRDKVTDEQIKTYYDQNVLDENFKQWNLSYYLTTDPNDAQNTLANMKKGEKAALEQLKPLVEQGDGFAAGPALPYNLGRVVNKMKKNEFSDVLQLRNGFLVLKVDDVRQLDKPKLDAVRNEIIQALALQAFNKELEQARRQAKVELG